MNEITSSNRPELFLQHQDGVPIMFYLTSRIPDDWAIWIRVGIDFTDDSPILH